MGWHDGDRYHGYTGWDDLVRQHGGVVKPPTGPFTSVAEAYSLKEYIKALSNNPLMWCALSF